MGSKAQGRPVNPYTFKRNGLRMNAMNEQPPSPDPAPAETAGNPRNPASRSFPVQVIVQLLLVVAVALLAWQWFDTHNQVGDMREELARRLSEMDSANQADTVMLKQQQETIRELTARVALLETHYAEIQSQRAELETLYREMYGNHSETTLSEVEQLLMIAGQQLQLSANIQAALIAMQQADELLARLNQDNLGNLRQVIGADIDKLRTLPEPNLAEINDGINRLIARVDGLPLNGDTIKAAASSPAPAVDRPLMENFLHEIWADLRHLLRIENTHRDELPLIPPSQAYFLRENLKLRLLSARLELLARNEDNFRQDLQFAQEWISRYFDPTAADSSAVLDTLQQLRKSRIRVALPDISDSLETVRNYRLSHKKDAQ